MRRARAPQIERAVLGLWLLVAVGSSLAADPLPTPAHHAYTKLYKEFDEGAKLSDGHKCFDEPAKLNCTVLSTSKQQSVHACRQECQCALLTSYLPILPGPIHMLLYVAGVLVPLHLQTMHSQMWARDTQTSSQRLISACRLTSLHGLEASACCGRDNPQCSSWLLCEDDGGCLDGTGSTISKHTCQLREEARKPWGIPAPGNHIMLPSNFASGYVKREPRANARLHRAGWPQLAPA